ncbi:hypothetical protein BH09VER1_BH09VER1_13320 [soil metagenome]
MEQFLVIISTIRIARGFSIMELLCVMAIMAILLTGALPALSSLLQSSNLTRGGQMMIDQLSMARQIAAAKNRTVEVRLIKLNPTDGAYAGLQLWTVEPNGSSTPADRLVRLPNDIYISTSPTLSPPFSTLTSSNMAVAGLSGLPYTSFKVRPAGSVEPVQAPANRSSFYFTFVNGRFTNSSTAPRNYVTLQINPDTANPIIYRP